jgi:hypothetical protein
MHERLWRYTLSLTSYRIDDSLPYQQCGVWVDDNINQYPHWCLLLQLSTVNHNLDILSCRSQSAQVYVLSKKSPLAEMSEALVVRQREMNLLDPTWNGKL